LKNLIKIAFLYFPFLIFGQGSPKKEINQQGQTWVSLNSVTKFSDHWGIMGDVHIRDNGFFESNNFYFLRGGLSYIPKPNLLITLGVAHLWLAPSNPEWSTYADENRIYQQFQFSTTAGKVGITQRLRNEQRWREKIVDDKNTDDFYFSNRVRYLLSLNIPIFENKKAPSLVISDEILVQFGSQIVYNTFDQNRLFLGIKQTISPKLSFDFGYMNVYQQKSSGYQYDMNHTLRLFFYLNTRIK
jgi:hypothetical protein